MFCFISLKIQAFGFFNYLETIDGDTDNKVFVVRNLLTGNYIQFVLNRMFEIDISPWGGGGDIV